MKIRESGGVGSDMAVTMDGFSGKHVKVFIDGVPQEGVGSSFGLKTFPLTSPTASRCTAAWFPSVSARTPSAA